MFSFGLLFGRLGLAQCSGVGDLIDCLRVRDYGLWTTIVITGICVVFHHLFSCYDWAFFGRRIGCILLGSDHVLFGIELWMYVGDVC